MRPVKVAVPTHTGQCFATDLALAGALSDMQILLAGVLMGLQLWKSSLRLRRRVHHGVCQKSLNFAEREPCQQA